jgi:hypothetical protein
MGSNSKRPEERWTWKLASTYCIPTGMPAMMNLYNPMEIVITPEITYILMSHNSDQIRRIYTDGRGFSSAGESEPPFGGFSIGTWIDENDDGKYDVLEVEKKCIGLPQQKCINGVGKKPPNWGLFSSGIRLGPGLPARPSWGGVIGAYSD